MEFDAWREDKDLVQIEVNHKRSLLVEKYSLLELSLDDARKLYKNL